MNVTIETAAQGLDTARTPVWPTFPVRLGRLGRVVGYLLTIVLGCVLMVWVWPGQWTMGDKLLLAVSDRVCGLARDAAGCVAAGEAVMSYRRMRTAAPTNGAQNGNGNGNGKFDPSTWAGQARSLARNEADASALLWGVVLGAGLTLGTLGLVVVGGATWRDVLSVEMGLSSLALVVVVGLVWVVTYARALRRDTDAVRLATWRLELERGIDLDGDGVLGPPPALQPVGHVMRIGGTKPVDVILPDLDPPKEARPLAGFPVCANDVLFILSRAAADGLTVRAWAGQRLPSGVLVDRGLWSAVVDGLVEWQFATATVDGAGRRRVELRGDVSVDVMAEAVRNGMAAG